MTKRDVDGQVDEQCEHLASLGTPGDRIEIVPHCPGWGELFERESARVRRACGKWIVDIEHIGSTAAPGLAAKPIIDIMPGLVRIEQAAHCVEPMERLGYEYLGEYGIPERAFFVLRHEGRRVVHAHMFARGSDRWNATLKFRDALRADPATCDAYAALKRRLAAAHGDDREAYTEGKSEFILSILDA